MLLLHLGLAAAVLLSPLPASGGEKRGGLVLQFDDGWSSWATTIGPELARVGGVATGFVNNQNLRSGRITLDELRTLQEKYGWEIGSHTWHHLNAPNAVRQTGITNWVAQELVTSVDELRAAGLDVRSLAFPFNALTPELAQAVRPLVASFRRADTLAIAPGIRSDGSVPGTCMDMATYVPPSLLCKWIDMAHDRGQYLFLFGHRVLPDSDFATGVVAAVSERELTATAPVAFAMSEGAVLVPDVARRVMASAPYHVVKCEGAVITLDRGDLRQAVAAGSTFLIGPTYGMRLSDFRRLVDYAAERVRFYRVREVVAAGPAPSRQEGPAGNAVAAPTTLK